MERLSTNASHEPPRYRGVLVDRIYTATSPSRSSETTLKIPSSNLQDLFRSGHSASLGSICGTEKERGRSARVQATRGRRRPRPWLTTRKVSLPELRRVIDA